jgi:hypothetical protein
MKVNKEIEANIMKCKTFGDLMAVLHKYYDTSFEIPFILKFGMAQKLPDLLKTFLKHGK